MQRQIKAVFMRGGTSKGIFFSGQDLQQYSQEIQEKIFLRAIGSPDPYQNHMDGMGGATSSTSKIAIINPSKREDCDIDYNFGAVPINGSKIDFSGNCGNLSAAAGLYAIEENLIKKNLHQNFKGYGEEQIEVKIYQENINQVMSTIIKCKNGQPLVEGDFKMAGLNNLGSEIIVKLQFDPQDKDNFIFPTKNTIDIIEYQDRYNNTKKIESTLINVGNPTIFIRSQDIEGLDGTCTKLENQEILNELEQIRCQGGFLMGLGESPQSIHESRPATPKISFLTQGGQDIKSSSGEIISQKSYDFNARILSMGKLHHAFTATGAISLVAGAGVKGTIVQEFLQKKIENNQVKIDFAHRSGVMDISSQLFYDEKQKLWKVLDVGFSRSARSIMKGFLQIPESTFN